MSRPFQAISRPLVIFSVYCAILFLLRLPATGESPGIIEKDVYILVDCSKSVDDRNRTSALNLISGLVGGKIPTEIQNNWSFQAAPASKDSEAVLNLERLSQGSGEGVSIAKEPCRQLISGLGNYQRTQNLRELLRSGLKTLERPSFVERINDSTTLLKSEDNSTHITLAESILAEALLGKASGRGNYYLIVVSDFHEDCFNRKIEDYAKPETAIIQIPEFKGEFKLSEANKLVFDGKTNYDDGNRLTGRYSDIDKESIAFFTDKIEVAELGSFEYEGSIEQKKQKVRIKVYAHSPKRSLAFNKQAYEWIYPAPAPEFSWAAEGVSAYAKLELNVDGNIRTFDGNDVAVDGTPYKYSLEDAFSKPPRIGDQKIILTETSSSVHPTLRAEAQLTYAVPKISFEGKFENTSLQAPAEPEHLTEIREEKFAGMLKPSPGACKLNATLFCGDKSIGIGEAGVDVDATGSFSIQIDSFPEETKTKVTSCEILRLVVSLPENEKLLAKDEALSAVCYLRVPKIDIWAAGFPKDIKLIKLNLRESIITFKSTHAGLNCKWSSPIINFQGGATPTGVRAEGEEGNVIRFDRNAPAGTYPITMAMQLNGEKIGSKDFEVQVPERTNWMLILLASMGVLSLGLFGWHFFQRR